MDKKEELTLDDMFALAFAGHLPGVAKPHAEMKTPSGRVFKYELSEYPISADVTPEQARTSGANLPGEVPVL